MDKSTLQIFFQVQISMNQDDMNQEISKGYFTLFHINQTFDDESLQYTR